jgi:DNA-binding CsgD family transcriptional regulator
MLKLTSRQEEIFRLIAEGRTNPEIAEELSLTRESIRDHIRNIYFKIKIHRRSEAIGWWLANSEKGS